MRLEVIDSIDALERFRSEWSSFTETIEGQTPFQSPEWLLAWWRHFGSGRLRVLVVYRGGDTLAGVIPLFRHEWQGRQQLTLIGSGISDYLEPALRPEHGGAIAEALRAHLLDTSDWDICEWQDLAADTPLARLAPLQEDTPCSEIKLDGSFDSYWGRRSKDLRRNLRRYGQRAEQTASFEFAVSCSADSDLIDELIRLHGDRWEKLGLPSMIAANHSAEFLRDIARQFEYRDILRLFTLRYEGRVAAISVGFLYRATLYSYLSAFDPHYETLGLGRRLLYESLRHAYEQQYTAWNFCRGKEPYKFSFGAVSIPKRRLILTRACGDIA